MPKSVVFKPENSKRKRLTSEEGSDDSSSIGLKKKRGTTLWPTQTSLMPREAYNFCKSILELEETKNIDLSRLKGNAKFSQLLQDHPIFDESIDIRSFQHSFLHYYRWATALSEVSLFKALQTVMDYVQGEQMVLRHPNFPKRPSSAFTRFAQLTGVNVFKTNGKTSADYKNDQDPRVVKAKQEHAKDRERFLSELQEFFDNHKDELFSAQIQFLQKEIKNAQKAVEQKVSKEPTRRAKSNVPPKQSKQPQKQIPSAFDLYKRSKGTKYDHLPHDDREAKLLRHFKKLSDEQRQIYESIATSLE
uniref:Uncharacterized protein n=1 Tax=Globodera rostochiensis TaxID=31243 RepID=A0A914GV81_GLORO